MCKTAYILAAYGGRSVLTRPDGYDRLVYLKTHLEFLNTVKHNLDQIVIVLNTDAQELSTYTEFVKTIPTTIGNTPVTLIRRPNKGVSYGAFTHAFNIFVDDFDYFIIVEDDWIPVEDHFDTTLVAMMQENPNTAYLCLWKTEERGYGPETFAGIPHGIIASPVIKKVQAHGNFKYVPSKGANSDGASSQVMFSRSVLPFGDIADVTHKYPFIFYETSTDVLTYDEENTAVIIVPYQYLEICNA